MAGKREKARKPVTARGTDLLNLIFDNGGMYLTQEEGSAEYESGNIAVDTNDTQGQAAMAKLTEKGLKAIGKDTPAPVEPMENTSNNSEFEIEDYAPEIERKKRGAKKGSKYPFDALKVGQSFHVPSTDKIPDPVAALQSTVTGARRRYLEAVVDASGNPVMETVEVTEYAVTSEGKRVKNADGSYIKAGVKKVTRQKMKATRDFAVVAAKKDDPKGPGARVVRTL